jgi:filamentous hemagglutinin
LNATALTYSDIENTSSASTSGYGIVLSPSGLPTPAVDMPVKQGDHGAALATLSPGKLTLSDQRQDLASLNNDVGKANTQAEFYDIQTLKRRQESAAAVSQILNTAIGDISQKLGFEDGSAQKIALHAAAGALTAVVSGGNIGLGAFAGGTQELIGAVIGKALMDNPNLTQEERNALGQWASVLVGMAAGGGQGSAIALDAETFNRQLHIEEAKLIAANASRYAVAQGYCADVSSCSNDAVELAIAELFHQAVKQVDITGANYPQNNAASSFLDSIAPKGSIPGLCNAGSSNCGQVFFHASGDVYRDSSINSDFFGALVRFYDLASQVYNQEHVTQIDIAGSLFRQAELMSGIHTASTGVDQAMLPWDVFNGIFGGAGGPFTIRQIVAEREAAATTGGGKDTITSGGKASASSAARLADYLASRMTKPVVADVGLQALISELYRSGAKVGTGSTADAVRQELQTGNPVGGVFHSQKAQDYSRALQTWLDTSPTASFSDRSAAQNVLNDMQNALKGK